MPARMNRNAFFIGLLAAACGGKSAPNNETLGSTHANQDGTTPVATQPTTPADPDLGFRLA